MTTGRKDDAGKLRWGLLRKSLVLPLEAVIRVLMYGANKYGDDNWQQVDNPLVRYRDALDRHLADIDKGVIVDPDTGENNYAHVATNALFLLWFYLAADKPIGDQERRPEPQLGPDALRAVQEIVKQDSARLSAQAPTAGDAVEYEVWQDGALQAGGREADYDAAKSEADHYARMYAQDGPVEVRIYQKRLLSAARRWPAN